MGLVIGVTGGAVGLILGSLRLPGLIQVLGMGPRIAAGTNLFIGFAMGASAGRDTSPGDRSTTPWRCS